jgi:molybdenum cofactor biosynthesis enzyme MoaA
MFDFEQVKNQIDFEYEYGIRDFEITGGEPSESLILRDICKYIKEKDNTSKIAIITNGGLFNSDVWDLIDEVLISYHLSRIG